MTTQRIAQFIRLVQNDDGEEIEAARDRITRDDLAPLAEVYWTLQTWDEKAGLIELIQDHLDPQTRALMLDFLTAPADEKGDRRLLVKAIALCHLDGDFAAFNRYYQERQLLAATVAR